jgi:hypothetical protein
MLTGLNVLEVAHEVAQSVDIGAEFRHGTRV